MTDPEPRAAPAPERPAMAAVWAALLAWAIPGAGHLALGRRGRAALFFLIVLTAVVIGLLLEGNLYSVVENRPLTILATLASMGMGLPYFLLKLVVGYTGDVTSLGYEYGTAFFLTAGLMNLLLVLDVWDIVLGRKE